VNAGDRSARAGSIGPLGDLTGLREMPCLFCGVHDEVLRFRDDPFRVVSCRRCGLVYVNPRLPSDRLLEMYQEAYWTSDRACEFGYTEYLADAPLYLRTNRLRRRVILQRKPGPGAVLDVGCAAGFFLSVMAELGWETTGVELSAPMVRYATDELALPDIRRGDLLSLELPPEHYDVVTLWDVVEHLEHPVAHLRAAARALKPDGLLLIETQNVASLFARILGRKWQHYKHAEHLYHFDPRSLPRLLDLAGFEQVRASPRHGGKYVSMTFLAERVGRVHPLLGTLAAPLRLLGRRAIYLNFMDELVVLARRR
jgi:2-polyprenyl-3-methyl-5-hydroxy-6-metoxy-1,4-benzoquinol methylase